MTKRFEATIMVTGSGEFSHININDKKDPNNPVKYELSNSINVEYLLNSLNEDIVLEKNKHLPLHMKILNKISRWLE